MEITDKEIEKMFYKHACHYFINDADGRKVTCLTLEDFKDFMRDNFQLAGKGTEELQTKYNKLFEDNVSLLNENHYLKSQPKEPATEDAIEFVNWVEENYSLINNRWHFYNGEEYQIITPEQLYKEFKSKAPQNK